MAKVNSLYGGFIGGRAKAIQFGPQDPKVAAPKTLGDKEAETRLAAHYQVGIKNLPPISGKRRPAAAGSVTGRKVSGGARVTGGTV